MSTMPYIPAFAALLAGASVFLFCPSLRRFHKFMGFTLIFEGLASLLNAALLSGADSFYAPSYLIYIAMLLAIPAFYYLAVKALLREDRFRGRDLWMLQTVLVFIVIYIPVVSGISSGDRDIFFRMQQDYPLAATTGASVLLTLDRTAYALYLIEYLFIQIFCIVNLSAYRNSIENYYSDLGGRTLLPVAAILSLMGLRFLILAASVFIPAETISGWIQVSYAAVSVLFCGIVAYSVCRVRHTAQELGKMAEAQAERMKAPVANDFIGARLEKLEEEKFFLTGNVNLIDTATRIGVNSKYVSDYLRFHYGETFMAYVNRLRIRCSTEFLSEGKMSMEEIADRAGYDTVSTFYRNFIKVMGISPSKYRENAR